MRTVVVWVSAKAAHVPDPSFHRNGSGYLPVPGDLIIESYPGGWGHVSVVDHTVGNAVYAVEQNASANGRHTYTLTGSTDRASSTRSGVGDNLPHELLS